MLTDIVVFAHPNGRDYVACWGEERRWYTWPAEAGGWAHRQRCTASLADDRCRQYEPFHARLALRLSGVADV